MQIHFLFPSEPFSVKNIDDTYREEAEACQKAGFAYSLIDLERLHDGKVVLNQKHPDLQDENCKFIYRGWMLGQEEYQFLEKSFKDLPAQLLTDTQTYLNSHHLYNWYSDVKELTIPTIFSDKEHYLEDIQKNSIFPGFIKDYVKSLTTERGSVYHNLAEAKEVVNALESYRGKIEGGLCIREFTALKQGTEERYFVFNGKAFARNGKIVPDVVSKVVAIHKAPFYSVDVAEKENGELVVIELGDGQVSDVKQWSEDGWGTNNFYPMFKT